MLRQKPPWAINTHCKKEMKNRKIKQLLSRSGYQWEDIRKG
jgi:phosphoserine phosphatase